jgi:hypothetical protein
MAKRLKTYRIDGALDDAVAATAARVGCTVTDVIIAALQEFVRNPPAPVPPGIKIITDDRMPDGLIALASPGPDGPSVVTARIKRKPGKCDHRVPAGAYCKQCGTTKT